jgi:ATP-binding cassette subfamily B protein
LIKLLFRLYDPSGGSISIDGVPLGQFDLDELRRNFSVVFQDYGQYSMSARDNIWIGDVSLSDHDEMIEIAARKAGADRVIDALPQGYDTKLGFSFDNGTELSDGQWQKIALARSFARDAQVVVLDEPTSALDAISEHKVFERFRELVRGRTSILISHRLSSVRMADRILVLDGGRIVEQGSHDELIRQRGLYAHLFETQALRYMQDNSVT